MQKRPSLHGFTLVELAIVITIIGLLIGGVLKGQELLENSRMTSMNSQMKSYISATITFRDIYKALPGDIVNPASFIQNCTASPCNISGDGNGMIGNSSAWGSDENNSFWLHLSRAGLISGVNPNATWDASTYFGLNSPPPSYPLGSAVTIVFITGDTNWPDVSSHLLHSFGRVASGGQSRDIPVNKVMKYDLKFDDGKPRSGDIRLCQVCTSATSYDPDNTSNCYVGTVTGF